MHQKVFTLPTKKSTTKKSGGRRSTHAKRIAAFFGAIVFITLLTFVNADVAMANAHIRLTDGLTPSSNPSDPAWVYFTSDSTQLPAPYSTSPNLSPEFFGINEYSSAHPADEKKIESLMLDAGASAYRATVYLNLFPEPNQSPPYWDFNQWDATTDGQRITRAIGNGQMVNIVVHRTPLWAAKTLPTQHPPEGFVQQEEVILNGTTPLQLSHKFILGENNLQYDKESVVAGGANAVYNYVDSETVGTGDGSYWQEYKLNNAPAIPGKLQLYVDGVLWNEVPYFQGSGNPNKNQYVFFPDTGLIRFGDGYNGSVPQSGTIITAKYSYYTNPYKEYRGQKYNTTDKLDYRIDYANGTIQRTANSSIPDGATVRVTYYYLDTSWWQEFWKELTAHYAGQVKYFEVWNEEDNSSFWMGTPAQYFEMLRTAYIGAKEGNPNAVVMLGGLAADSGYLPKLYNLGAQNYFDALAWHPYGWQTPPDNPQSQFNITNSNYFQSAAANGDTAKPVFLNEVGFSTNQQGGMNWDAQGIALSRMYMMLARNPQVVNVSWWGVGDTARLGNDESDPYTSHLGLLAMDSSGNLLQKPAYYTFKNLATNKGVIIDLAAYNADGSVQQSDYTFNKIVFSSLGEDFNSVNVLVSEKNANDWNEASSTMTVAEDTNGIFEYTLLMKATTARFVQIQFVKKTGVNKFSIGEIQVITPQGDNTALKKYYSVAGFEDSASVSPAQPEVRPPQEPAPQTTPQPPVQTPAGQSQPAFNPLGTIVNFFKSLFGLK